MRYLILVALSYAATFITTKIPYSLGNTVYYMSAAIFSLIMILACHQIKGRLSKGYSILHWLHLVIYTLIIFGSGDSLSFLKSFAWYITYEGSLNLSNIMMLYEASMISFGVISFAYKIYNALHGRNFWDSHLLWRLEGQIV